MSAKESFIKSEPRTDVDLIHAFLGGDERAFDSLVLKYQKMVINLCYRILGDYDEANDSAQETFVKVFRSLYNFKFRSAFSTWLYRIAVNTCKNKLGSFKYRFHKKMVRINGQKDPDGAPLLRESKNRSPSPEEGPLRKERERSIQKAIDSLPKDQKTVVVLRDIDDLSYEEITKITGYTLGTVKSKIFRAREQLRNKLKGLL